MRLIVADDSVLLREGLSRVLGESGFEVVGQAGDAAELLHLVDQLEPDVAIVDIKMPPTRTDEGIRAAREIRTKHPNVGVLVLSQYLESSYALKLLADGAAGTGYLLKEGVADIEALSDAIRRVARGEVVVDRDVVAQLVAARTQRSPLDDLTAREKDVLSLMAEGRSNQAIGDRLFLSPRTVENHVTSIFTKLQLAETSDDNRRVLAVLTYLRS